MSWECISQWIEQHPGLASWVQAVGAVVAIFTAVFISHRDTTFRRKAERDARCGALIRAQAVTAEAEERVESAFRAVQEHGVNQSLLASLGPHLEQCRQYLTDALSVHGLDSDIYAELFKARKAVEEVLLMLPGLGMAEVQTSATALLNSIREIKVKLSQL